MIEIILIVIFLCMLISVAFAGGGLGSIAVCIISAGLLVIRIASGKFLHLDKKILVVIHMVCFAMMCFFGLTDGGTDTVHRAGIYDESIKQTIQAALSANTLSEREDNIVKAQAMVADMHNSSGLTDVVDYEIESYFGRDIKVIFADKFAELSVYKSSDNTQANEKSLPFFSRFSRM